MTITVRKDTTRRLGGWALIGFPGPGPQAVSVIIHRDEGTQYLGPHGWQGAPHQFDPYTVQDGPGGLFIRVGPEIVNHLEPYLPVTITLPEASVAQMLSWPDEVIPSPDAFEGGGVQGAELLMPEAPHLRTDRAPEPIPEPVAPAPPPPPIRQIPPAPPPEPFVQTFTRPPEPEPDPVPPEPDWPTISDDPPKPASGLPWILLVLLLLIGAGVGGYLYWEEVTEFVEEASLSLPELLPDPDPVTQDPVTPDPVTPDPVEPQTPTETPSETTTNTDPAPDPDPTPTTDPTEPVTPDPQPALGPPTCSTQDATAPQDVERLRDVMMLCREAGNVAVEVEALDRLPASGDTDLRWGQIYDPSREEAGRPYRVNADSALRSYKRALGRGEAVATTEIERLCGWLSSQGGLSNQAVFARHCE